MFRTNLRIAAIVPAAGRSLRMGCDKRQLPFGKSTILETTVSNLCDAGCYPVVVVLEPVSRCRHLTGLEHPGVTVRLLDAPSDAMLDSVRAGLSVMPKDIEAVAIVPADCPLVRPSVIQYVISAFDQGDAPLVVPMVSGRQGHPRIIGRSMFGEFTVTGATRLSDFFRSYPDRVAFVELADECAVLDCDTRADYIRLLQEEKRYDERTV